MERQRQNRRYSIRKARISMKLAINVRRPGSCANPSRRFPALMLGKSNPKLSTSCVYLRRFAFTSANGKFRSYYLHVRAFLRAACFGATRPLARLRLGLRPRLHFETLHVSAAHVLPRPNGLFRRPVDRSAYTSTPSGRGPAEIGSSERSPPGEGPETRRACTPNEFAADPPRRLVRPRSPRAFSRRLPPVRGAIRCRRVRLLVSHRAPPGRSTNRTSAALSARLRRLSTAGNKNSCAFGLERFGS